MNTRLFTITQWRQCCCTRVYASYMASFSLCMLAMNIKIIPPGLTCLEPFLQEKLEEFFHYILPA